MKTSCLVSIYQFKSNGIAILSLHPTNLTFTNDRCTEDNNDSLRDVLLAAGIGNEADDPDLPCLTIRMWAIGILFCILGSGLNTLYTFRFPSISISQSAIQFLAYPIGKAWEYVLPDWGVTVWGTRVSLNPGPFNYKVSWCICIVGRWTGTCAPEDSPTNCLPRKTF